MDLPEDHLFCPVCREVFKDPVILSCSHSFCGDCIQCWWSRNQQNSCPISTRKALKKYPTQNRALKDVTEAFRQMKLKQTNQPIAKEVMDFCSVHSEKLKLFCLKDLQPVSVVCRDSKAHRNHRFKPIDEAEQDLKEELQKSLRSLEENLKCLREFKEDCDLTLAHIKEQSHHTERQIEEQFIRMHQFLLEEEEARKKALREEEEQKTQRMKDKMAAVNREIEALSETIRATEEQLRAADVSFLLRYKAAVDRVQRCPLLEEPQLGPGALIDQAKHLGNLGFNIWTNMKKLVHYSPVILDPNTAHPELVLSDDLTSFIVGEEQQLPKNPERVREPRLTLVCGSEGLNSSSQSWDVDVGVSDEWELGVVTESAYSFKNDDEYVDDDVGWWAVVFSGGQYTTFNRDKKKDTVLKLKSNPQRIRLHLDCNKHKLTLYDADTNTHIHSFTQLYQQKLFPIFRSNRAIYILHQVL